MISSIFEYSLSTFPGSLARFCRCLISLINGELKCLNLNNSQTLKLFASSILQKGLKYGWRCISCDHTCLNHFIYTNILPNKIIPFSTKYIILDKFTDHFQSFAWKILFVWLNARFFQIFWIEFCLFLFR